MSRLPPATRRRCARRLSGLHAIRRAAPSSVRRYSTRCARASHGQRPAARSPRSSSASLPSRGPRMPSMPFETSDEILDYYRGLCVSSDGSISDYVGYSEASLKRVLLRTVLALPGRKLVEFGCGPHPVTLYAFAEHGWNVFAAEISADFCRNARALADARGVPI